MSFKGFFASYRSDSTSGSFSSQPPSPVNGANHNQVVAPYAGNSALAACSKETSAFLGVVESATVKLVVPNVYLGMDATGSRSGTWNAAQKMNRDVVQFLVEQGEATPMLRISYFNGGNTFQATKWMDKVDPLVKWMSGVSCATGTTQIGRAFQDVQTQIGRGVDVSSVTYIGDHVDGDTAENLYVQARDIGRTTPINVLHEVGNEECLDSSEREAQKIFKQIAGLSGGEYIPFSHANYRDMTDCMKVFVSIGYGRNSKAIQALRSTAALSGKAKDLLNRRALTA